ncbi:Uncharacterised protein [Klebsiella pneumoniae]|nr:Uncharacterised protein [Klebsiella pneumoniae]
MGMAGNQNVQPVDLACGLNIFIQRTPYIGPPLTRLACRDAFVNQSYGQIHFTFQFIDIVL